MRKALLASSIFFIFQYTVAAQEEIELDPITVTSSLTPVSVSRTGRNIIVVKGEEFNRLPVNSIAELLRYLPGLEVQSRGAMGSQSDLVIRGGTFQQVLVLLDGIRLNDPVTGHFNSYIPIAPAEIERIEILKGASSAIYGSEAVGGVIHVITKSFAAIKGKKQKSAGAKIAAGDYHLFAAGAGGFYNNGKTSVSGGFLTNNSKGQPLRGTDAYFNLHTASLSLNHYINDKFKIGIRSAYDDRKFSAQNFYTSFRTDTATERVKSLWNHAQFSYQIGRNKYSIDAGYKATDDTYFFSPRSTPNLNKSKLWQVLLKDEHSFGPNLSLTSGIQFINRSIASNDRGNHNENQLAAFTVVNYFNETGFGISPALRIDWHQRRGVELVPQVNLSYNTGKVQLRGSAGKTIRDADFTERYNNYNKPLVQSGRLGNPDLTSEYAFAYEAGADWLFNKALKISASYFGRKHNDLIDYITTPYSEIPRKVNLVSTGNYALAKNVAKVSINGLELDLQFQKKLSEQQSISGMTGFVLLDTKTSETTPPLYVSSYARFLANYNLTYIISCFNMGVNGLYKLRSSSSASPISAVMSGDYFLMNVKAGFTIAKKGLGIFAQADNIFDKEYSDLLGAIMPRRWMMFGATYTLQ
jgi:iron complex outermembrane receptor protein